MLLCPGSSDLAPVACERISHDMQGNGVVPDVPLLGTAMPIVIFSPAQPPEGSLKPKLVLPAVGSWVKLRNVKSWVKAGQLQVPPCKHQ